jgi:peptidoglycan hydrolase CwlO-like protein
MPPGFKDLTNLEKRIDKTQEQVDKLFSEIEEIKTLLKQIERHLQKPNSRELPPP